jgi:kynurenine formamidase
LFGRTAYAHEFLAVTRNDWEDRLDGFYPQASTQWDALGHVRCREYGFYGGLTDDPEPGGPLGVDAYAEHGLVGRGVLLDVDRHLAERGEQLGLEARAITAQELESTATAQGISIEPGDVLCVRTGWTGRYLRLDRKGRERIAGAPTFPGLQPDEEMARRLWNWGIAAVVCDNPAIETSESDPSIGSLHRRLLPLLGMALGELFVLDPLAQACAADERWEFLFVGVPLKVPGGLGSPGNAVAIR